LKIIPSKIEDSPRRDVHIDILKGLLVIQMIFAHCLQINGTGDYYGISPIANTVSFTGFTFCFGFATWKAYFSKSEIKYVKAIKTSIKCLLAYFISAIFHEVVRKGSGLSSILDILSFKILAGYSEFLLSFSLMIFIPIVFRRFIDISTNNEISLLIASAACSISTFYHPAAPHPLLGSLIGGDNFSYFPVISYFPIFMAGVYTSKKGRLPLAFCAIGFISLAFRLLLDQGNISRFPPSLWWVASSFGGLIFYIILTNTIVRSRIRFLINALKVVGENVLAYLLLSNIIIFTFSRSGYTGRETKTTFAIYALVMGATIFVLNLISRRPSK